MRLLPTVLVSAVVASAALVVHDRWIAPCRDADPYAAEALDRLESQMKALAARRATQQDPRMARVEELLAGMGLSLTAAQHERVLGAIAAGFRDRERLLKDPALAAWSDEEFARRFRAAVEPHMNDVRVTVGDAQAAEAIVKRFIYDGRPIRKPDPTQTPSTVEVK